MRGYRLTFWGKNGRREGTCSVRAETDRDAYRLASKMLSQTDCSTLEVWRDTELLARIGAELAPPPMH
jgi:hypothetical protein